MGKEEEQLCAETGSFYDELSHYLTGFSELLSEDFNIDVQVDAETLWNVAGSFAQDLKRYKDFHEIEIPDRARRSAYACKWLMRLRPIAAHLPPENTNETATYFVTMINEAFASFVSGQILDVDLDTALPPKVLMIFQYSLRYRGYCEDTFILLFSYISEEGRF